MAHPTSGSRARVPEDPDPAEPDSDTGGARGGVENPPLLPAGPGRRLSSSEPISHAPPLGPGEDRLDRLAGPGVGWLTARPPGDAELVKS